MFCFSVGEGDSTRRIFFYYSQYIRGELELEQKLAKDYVSYFFSELCLLHLSSCFFGMCAHLLVEGIPQEMTLISKVMI